MDVKLISYTHDAEKVIAGAAKLCYSNSGINDLFENLSDDKIESLIKYLHDYNHESPIEHCIFTFAVEGVSRALLAQLTRHRIASYSVQSQRYVNKENFTYVIPTEIANDDDAKKVFVDSMEDARLSYIKLSNMLKTKYLKTMDPKSAEKKANEDARYVLPNACDTKIIFSMNARSLNNFFCLRCCTRAQWEIRELANKMLKLVKEVAPTLFFNSGPTCKYKGICTEGSMSCGAINNK